MTLKLNGSSSGSVSIDAPASTTSGADITFKFPVADGSAGQVLQTDGSGNLSWVTPNVPIADQYAITSARTSTEDPIDAWARQDNTAFSATQVKGGGVSQSSGVFTFPSTGYWLVSWTIQFYFASGGDAGAGFNLFTTNNNGTDWTAFTNADVGGIDGNEHTIAAGQALLDITNVSNQKVCFKSASFSSGTQISGSTSDSRSNVVFLRIGDT